MLSIDEAVKMQGTEFEYDFNGKYKNVMQAYVKSFSPKGFSCWSFGFETSGGTIFEPLNDDEAKEGACCLIGMDFVENPEFLDQALAILEEIKLTGRRVIAPYKGGTFTGCPL